MEVRSNSGSESGASDRGTDCLGVAGVEDIGFILAGEGVFKDLEAKRKQKAFGPAFRQARLRGIIWRGSWRVLEKGFLATGTFKEDGTPTLEGLKSGKPLLVTLFDATLRQMVAQSFSQIS